MPCSFFEDVHVQYFVATEEQGLLDVAFTEFRPCAKFLGLSLV